MPGTVRTITTMQVVATAIVLLAIGGLIWAVGYGGEFLKDDAKVTGLFKFSAAIVTVATILILLFYFVSNSKGTEEGKTSRLELMKVVMAVTPMQWVASLIGLTTITGIIWVIASGDDILRDAEKTRGLITFSVAIVTVAIALIMVFYSVFGSGLAEEIKERFTFGKDILMVFVGILGTVMGFYYGAENLSKAQIKSIADVVQKPAGSQNDPEQKALDLLIKKDFDGTLKAFDDAFNATPALPNIGNIAAIKKLLTDYKEKYTAATDDAKQKLWQEIFREISKNGLTVGMTDEMKKTISGYSNPAPSPSPISSPAASPN